MMHGTVQGDIESTSILKPDTDVSSSYLNEVTQNRQPEMVVSTKHYNLK